MDVWKRKKRTHATTSKRRRHVGDDERPSFPPKKKRTWRTEQHRRDDSEPNRWQTTRPDGRPSVRRGLGMSKEKVRHQTTTTPKKKRNGLFGQRRPSQRGRFFARRSRSRLGVGGVGVGRLEAAPRAPASLAVGRREARRARQEERLVEGVAGVGALAHQQHRAQRPLRRRLGKVEHLGVPNKKKPTINPTVTRV